MDENEGLFDDKIPSWKRSRNPICSFELSATAHNTSDLSSSSLEKTLSNVKPTLSEEPPALSEGKPIPNLKREKSYNETIERKKKKVKFSSDGNELIIDTRTFDSVTEIGNPDFGVKVKKLLKKGSRKRKASIETQTEEAENPFFVEESSCPFTETNKHRKLVTSEEVNKSKGLEESFNSNDSEICLATPIKAKAFSDDTEKHSSILNGPKLCIDLSEELPKCLVSFDVISEGPSITNEAREDSGALFKFSEEEAKGSEQKPIHTTKDGSQKVVEILKECSLEGTTTVLLREGTFTLNESSRDFQDTTITTPKQNKAEISKDKCHLKDVTCLNQVKVPKGMPLPKAKEFKAQRKCPLKTGTVGHKRPCCLVGEDKPSSEKNVKVSQCLKNEGLKESGRKRVPLLCTAKTVTGKSKKEETSETMRLKEEIERIRKDNRELRCRTEDERMLNKRLRKELDQMNKAAVSTNKSQVISRNQRLARSSELLNDLRAKRLEGGRTKKEETHKRIDEEKGVNASRDSTMKGGKRNCGLERDKLMKALTDATQQKKELESALQEMRDREKKRVAEFRQLHEEHETAVTKILKSNKLEAVKMMDELRAKERAIGRLKKTVNTQDAKLRLQEEKVSEGKTSRHGKSSSRDERPKVSDIPEATKGTIVNEVVNNEENKKEKENKEVMESEIKSLKETILEQQHKIDVLTDGTQVSQDSSPELLPSWISKRESCVKVSELPTVLEQNTEEEILNSTTDFTSSGLPSPFNDISTPETVINTDEPLENLLSHQYAKFSSQENLDTQSHKSSSFFPSASSSITDLMSSQYYYQKDGTAWWWQRMAELELENKSLKSELQESRDHAELLEFRVLEITEAEEKTVETCDQATFTDFPDHSSSGGHSEDLSLPLSIDSGLDLSNDLKARVAEGRAWLAQVTRSTGEEVSRGPAIHLTGFLDWLASLSSSNTSPPLMSPTTSTPEPSVKPMDSAGPSDLSLLVARLQEVLADPTNQEAAIADTISKLHDVDSSLKALQERLLTLTEENRELQEALSSLSEAHETRTEDSGTESELIHRKTPSFQSDLSDAESDGSDASSRRHKPMGMDTSSSFQESGIFDTSCELVHSSTQTVETDPLFMYHNSVGIKSEEIAQDDLQSAVARLASIRAVVQDRDIRHFRLQDLQESDEYLRAALENGKIVINKLDYDSIVNTERKLQQEIEHLKCEKEQLATECQSLKTQLLNQQASCRRSDAEEVLKAQVRVLTERLVISDRCKIEYFEEKCELEEADNDARLMIQRMESQLEAAREMESLLSASLSQEQEISREYQRRLREMQILDKERKARISILEIDEREAQELAQMLEESKNNLENFLSFVGYGLLVSDLWRKIVPNSAKALVPYTVASCDVFECLRHISCKYAPFGKVSLCDCGLTAEIDASQKIEYRSESRNIVLNGPKMPYGTRCQATMTMDDQPLSEREDYYLQQIEALQREKILLRKEQEVEKHDTLRLYNELDATVRILKLQLQEAEKDKCNLIFRLQETEDQRDEARQALQERVDELKGDLSRHNDYFHIEKQSLQRDYEAKIYKISQDRNRQEERIQELEKQLANLRGELETFGVAIMSDLAECESAHDSVTRNQGSLRAGTDGDVLRKVRELVKSESLLQEKISNLEKKECAYRQTIQEADNIMAHHATTYTKRIEDLEGLLEQKNAKISQLENSEERLRSSLRSNSRNNETARISSLLDRLIQVENSELKLKESVWNLERKEKELQIKLVEAEKTNQGLKGELRDQEELVHRLMTLETENNSLASEVQQAHDSAKKIGDVQQKEVFLQRRVEELELSENALRDALEQSDLMVVQRERKLKDQISCLEEEIQNYKYQLENANSKEQHIREAECSLKKEMEDLKEKLRDAEREILEFNSESKSHETQHRTEVAKLRNQLKLVNGQLTDLDGLNCVLREKVSSLEETVEEVTNKLEENCRRHEQDLMNVNFQISEKDAQLEELQSHFEQLQHCCNASELDELATLPIASIHTSLSGIISELNNCDKCKDTHSGELENVKKQLGVLSELLDGCSVNDESVDLDGSSERIPAASAAENLANYELLATSPPDPTGEGLKEVTSGDDFSVDPYIPSLLREDKIRRSQRRLEERNKRRALQGGSNILEELEEKVRELEEAVSCKEEELKLADSEAKDMQMKLGSRDALILEKEEELRQLRITVSTLQEELMKTIQEYQRNRIYVEDKHKVDLEKLTKTIRELSIQMEEIKKRSFTKDSIISTLVFQIKSLLRSGNMTIILNQLQQLREKKTEQVADFDVESVCELVNMPFEIFLSRLHDKEGMSSQADSDSGVSSVGNESPPPKERRKSRIPRILIPISIPSILKNLKLPITSARRSAEKLTREVIPGVKRECQSKLQGRPKSDDHSNNNNNTKECKTSSNKPSLFCRQSSKSGECNVTENFHSSATTSKPVADIRFKRKSLPAPLPPKLASTAPNVVPRKSYHQANIVSNSNLTDEKRVNRMVTSVAPLHSAVQCASAPEWHKQRPNLCKDLACIPRPRDLRITRRVGVDGVVIAWAPMEHDCIAGFQILVNGHVVQQVRTPHRTKALVTNLPFASSFTIGLVVVAKDGRCSVPAIVSHDRSSVYNGRLKKLSRKKATCL